MNKLVVRALVSTAFLAAVAAHTGVSHASETTSATHYPPAAVMKSAYTKLVSGNPQAAIAEYTTVLTLSETTLADKATSLLNRALAHQQLDAHDAAIADYTSAIELDALNAKTRAVALYNRGIAHSKNNDQASAIDDYTNALYLNPYLAEAYYSRGNALREAGQYKYALIDYAKAEKFNYPHPHLALYGTALTLAKLGHTDEATATLFRVYGMKPDFKPARDRLAGLGIDVPENPTSRQIKLAILPTQNLLADNIVTGSTQASSAMVEKLAQREPVAPPTGLLNGARPDEPGAFMAEADQAPAPVKVAGVAVPSTRSKPEDISVAQVEAVPALPARKQVVNAVASVIVAKPEAPSVQIEPVSAPAEKASVNLTSTEGGNVSAKFEGWTVQLVSQRDADKAWSNWDSLQKRYGSLLGGQAAAVVKADVEGQGTYYRLRVHKLEKNEAQNLCKSLKRKGTGCFVSRAG